MAIRWRKDGRLLCAAKSEARPDDTYINDRLQYQLDVTSRAIVPDIDHEDNGLLHWVHGDKYLRAKQE